MDDGVVRLRGGCLSLHTHANKVQLNWSRILYRSGLTSFSGDNRCWDCALIEILDTASVISRWEVGKTMDTLLNEHVQNVALTDEKKHIVGGIIIEESKEFAFLPTFALSGASGCRLYDDSGFIIGIVQSTTDKINGVVVPQGTYSIESLEVYLFVRWSTLDTIQ